MVMVEMAKTKPLDRFENQESKPRRIQISKSNVLENNPVRNLFKGAANNVA